MSIALTLDHRDDFRFVLLPSCEKKLTTFSEARRAKFPPWPKMGKLIKTQSFQGSSTHTRSARERRFIAKKLWLSIHLRNPIPVFCFLSLGEIVWATLSHCKLDLNQCLQGSLQKNCLAQNNLLEYQTYLDVARQGHQITEGQLASD